MANQTNISWCDSTFNPWMGCTKVSPACDHCYAERDTARFGRVEWGAGKPRVRTSAANWRKPLQWNKQPFYECKQCGWRGATKYGNPVCCDERAQPARRRVFCASLADVFDNEVDPQWRADLLHLIFQTPGLDWLLLTKRIGNAQAMLEEAVAHVSLGNHTWAHQASRGFRHVWIGATICNQVEADRDIPKLLAIPAAVRFLSIEPMLGPIQLPFARLAEWNELARETGNDHAISALHWVIAGGESGPNARPMHPDWVRTLRDQCAAAGVPFHFKQWGEWEISSVANGHHDCDMVRNRAHWVFPDGHTQKPSSIRDGWTGGDPFAMVRVGKKAAGRSIDGRTHDGFPAPGGNADA